MWLLHFGSGQEGESRVVRGRGNGTVLITASTLTCTGWMFVTLPVLLLPHAGDSALRRRCGECASLFLVSSA